VEQYTKIQCRYRCNNVILQVEPREVNATKLVREFRSAMLECDAWQREI